ncbi:DoxX family protein [Rhizobium sp. LjRoot258]|jgi:hypothetical protein|uniref:DoxX family protein n=1 Tax=Rhizobium sp. LjRoot258 TaxID=3342299 RepID=UPI003ECF2E15
MFPTKHKFSRLSALQYLLAAFFVIGGVGNIAAPASILADYQRWGYPWWFHYVTGVLELTTSILLLSRYRIAGALLGSAAMAAAVGTVAFHGEYTHAIPPLAVLTLCAAAAALFGRKTQVNTI